MLLIGAVCAISLATFAQTAPPDLTGLWRGKLRFGPDVRGDLLIFRSRNGWRADIAGFSVPAGMDAQTVSFELPEGNGTFRGRKSGGVILGQWISERLATPVTLRRDGTDRWRGVVTPLDQAFTFYLPVTRQPDGTLRTYLRNPERNVGIFTRVTGIRLDGDRVLLTARRAQADTTLVEGRYDSEEGTMSIPLRGGTYEFVKVDEDSTAGFYPRGRSHQRYGYTPPLKRDDGWPVATVEDVGISRDAIEKFVQMLIDMPMDSLSTSQIHSLLIARHGKLVVEEYFHGYHRDMPHDTRSAAKSWTATLIGAAMQAGVPLRLNTPVYQTMLGSLPSDLDPRKRAMTLEHLVSMTAGFDCDDGKDRPGAEDVMQQQTKDPDWYHYTLNVPRAYAPGDTIIYCSAEPNLAGGVLRKIAGEPLPELFDRLVGRPLQMSNYHLFLSPTGDAYGGGGHQFTPRDFLKFAQLMVNEGKWNGRQIFSKEWAIKSGSALRDLNPSKTQQYGYLWNSVEYPYKDRKVRAIFAGGNGGQIFMGIPALDLVIGFTGGNYNDNSLFIPQRVFVPKYILPAVN
ncbi:MAG TPA: serine hydrolase domain-containing protein [Gemmatimonadaceae bacterium]